jgi:hypothetical protein
VAPEKNDVGWTYGWTKRQEYLNTSLPQPVDPNQTKPNQNKLDKNKQLVQVYLSHMHAAANEEGFCRRYATYSSVFKLSLLPFKLHLAIHFIKKKYKYHISYCD